VSETRFVALTTIVGLVFVAAVYLPAVGRGFVKDDFRWLADARTALAEPAQTVLPRLPNFYRPVVTASFAADYALFGLNARAYGLTNLTLYLGCAAAIFSLLREVGIGRAPAAAGAFAWALNPHGINMAVVWLSGRTSLLLTLFAVLSMLAFLRGRRWIGSAWLLAALLSKEEAVALPLVFLVWLFAFRRGEGKDRIGRIPDAIALFAPLVVYLAARAHTPALTPSTAPSFYRLTADPHVVGVNALSYFDRGVTFFVFMTVVAVIAYGLASIRARRHAGSPFGAASPTRLPRWLAAGGAWLAGGYAVTVWLPVRSSLYAVLPSVGAAVICAALVEAMRDASGRRARGDLRFGAAVVAMLVFVPVYQHRNDRWVEPARLSARIVQALTTAPPIPGSTGVVVFEDEPGGYATFDTALGALASSAVQVVTNLPLEARIIPPGHAWTGLAAARYRLTSGRVERIN
jgi:hypothetical protein